MTGRARRPTDALIESLPRLTLVAGKGGVGKTTCAAALAVRAAERGERTMLVSTDPAGTLGDALGITLGPDPQSVELETPAGRGRRRAALDVLQLQAEAERRRFLERWRETIVTIVDRGTYLDLDDISGVVDAALPGADEVFAMLRLAELESFSDYARILVDTAPTGHTLRLLDLPRAFAATIDLLETMQAKHRFVVRSLTRAYRADAADAFLAEMRARTSALVDGLRDRARVAALLVTRAEAVVVAETARYAVELAAGGIHVAGVVANALPDAQPAPAWLGDVVPASSRYAVPLLADPPIGLTGLRRWADALDVPGAPSERRSERAKQTGRGRTPRRGAPSSAPSGAIARDHEVPRRLLAGSLTIVGGKGGVGKTTTACALALDAAALEPPVLLVSADPAPSVADVLGHALGDTETPVPGAVGLLARQIDAPGAFREFQLGYQERVDAIFDAFVRQGVDAAHDRAIFRDLLALAPPGIDELYALASLGETLAERRFARVIVDPAPTGHLLRLLQMPGLALEWSHRLMRLMLKYREVGGLGAIAEELLAFARRTRALGELLRDPARAALVVVALDEPLVRAETTRLIGAARAEGIAVNAVLWNRIPAGGLPRPLPVAPPVAQYVAPAAMPPPAGAGALRAWAGLWRELSEIDG